MSARPRVLVIDDDPLFRSLITSILRREFLVTVAGDGAEGYHKALEFPPQLAIIDIQMPGWDGLRTLQALQAHQALARIPVMMLTSDSSRQTVVAAVQAGARDYVIKANLDGEELLNKVRRMLGINPAPGSAGDPSPPAPAASTLAAGTATPEPGGAMDKALEASALQSMVDNWE